METKKSIPNGLLLGIWTFIFAAPAIVLLSANSVIATIFGVILAVLAVIFFLVGVISVGSEPADANSVGKKVALKIAFVLVMLVLLFCFKMIMNSVIDGESVKRESSGTVTCRVCDRSFNKGSANAKSIARSNMCENCHDNFEWRQEAQDHIDNQPVN